MVTPRHSEGVGAGPGAGGEGDAAGEVPVAAVSREVSREVFREVSLAVSPARLQPYLSVTTPSLWQRGQGAGRPVLAYQLHVGSGNTTTTRTTSDYNSCDITDNDDTLSKVKRDDLLIV